MSKLDLKLVHALPRARNDVKFAWKVQRDVSERGWTEDQVLPLCWLKSSRGTSQLQLTKCDQRLPHHVYEC